MRTVQLLMSRLFNRVSTIVLLLVIFLTGQEILIAQKFDIKHIDYSYGLSNSQVTSLKNDQFGFIWIGTQGGGVYRWDGDELKPLSDSLKYHNIIDVLPVGDHGIWVATYDALNLVNKFSEFMIMDSLVNLHDDMVVHLYETDSSVITFSQKGSIHSISKSNLRPFDNLVLDSLGKREYKVFQTNNVFHVFAGEQYFQVKDNGGRLILNESMSISEKFNLDYPVSYYSIHKVRSKWLVKDKGVVYFFNRDFKNPVKRNMPLSKYAFCINYFKGFWWVSNADGLFRLKLDEKGFEVVEKHLSTPSKHSLVTDKNQWIGGFNGIYELTLPKIQPVQDPPYGVPGYFAYTKVNDKIWAGGVNTGIVIYNQKGNIVDSIRYETHNRNVIRAFLDRGDYLLVCAGNEVLKVDKYTHQTETYEGIKDYILAIAESESKEFTYYGSAKSGLLVQHKNEFTYYNVEDGMPDNRVWALLPFDEDVVIGTEKGVALFHNDTITKLDLGKSFEEVPVTSLARVNENVIAIGFAQYGLILYDLKTNEIQYYLTDKNGLSSSYIYFLKMIDEELWVGSSLGTDIINFKESGINIFQLRDIEKVGGAETFLNGIIELESDIWVSTIAGTISVPKDIERIVKRSKSNPVVIEKLASITINDPIYYTSFFDLSENQKVFELPYSHNSLKILFNTAEYEKTQTRFMYQLEGYDPAPTEPTNYRSAVYKQLPPGQYTFKVWRYPVRPGEEVEAASVKVVIATPFYMTDVFRIFALLAPVVIIVYLMWLKSQSNMQKAVNEERIRQEAQDELRKEMAIDFHDEMGNHLAKIINFSGVLKMKGLSYDQLPIVNKIERSAQELFVSTKDLLWSLKKGNNNLEEIFFHIKDFSDRLYDRTNTQVRLNKNTDASHILLNPKASRDLSLIIKEALTNIYKHADAENVSLDVNINGKEYATVLIKDDGGGFDFGGLNGHNGLKNMQQRAVRSGFELNIKSDPGIGTNINIKINKEQDV
ncbi:ligand-binding sensor domain-containing protein [Marinigracilibium pacificum]|uniref:histidine kinase n=1 Tax=Marinigracilibium pacificum TaxID=2729599 RepID=A0A848IVQ7_9BACT|nr:triple tyrosine motif-containing protein [Marinigracilibium pacificum]NMM47365.1 hypothetical protein [Marinigracilibium pacificum]